MNYRVGRHTVYDEEEGRVRRYTENEENLMGDREYDAWREEQVEKEDE